MIINAVTAPVQAAELAYLAHARQAVHFKNTFEQHLPLNGSCIHDCLVLGLQVQMTQNALQAGSQFASYRRDLKSLDDDPLSLRKVSEELNADAELLKLFHRGFEEQKARLAAN